MPAKIGMGFPEMNDPFHIREEVLCSVIQRPVVPINFVVLTIRVVIAVLRFGKLIAAEDHRYPLRKQEAGDHGLF